jgi:hypothetical protein
VGNKRGIVIVTMGTKLTLSFLFLTTLTPLSCKSRKQTYLTQHIRNLPFPTYIVKIKLGKPADFLVFLGLTLQNPLFWPGNEARFIKNWLLVEELVKRCTKRYVQSFGDWQN